MLAKVNSESWQQRNIVTKTYIINYSVDNEIEEDIERENLQVSTHPYVDNRLQRSRTANSLLGLTVLLNGNEREYAKWPIDNHASNNYFGFKVSYMK